MRSRFLLASALAVLALPGVPALAQAPSAAMEMPSAQHILNLNCIQDLAVVGESDLAGIFAYVSDKDVSAAFADLLTHKPKAMKKFMEKLNRDNKETGAIAQWDKEVVSYVLAIYSSPLASLVAKPSAAELKNLNSFMLVPALSLGDMTARRKPQ